MYFYLLFNAYFNMFTYLYLLLAEYFYGGVLLFLVVINILLPPLSNKHLNGPLPNRVWNIEDNFQTVLSGPLFDTVCNKVCRQKLTEQRETPLLHTAGKINVEVFSFPYLLPQHLSILYVKFM